MTQVRDLCLHGSFRHKPRRPMGVHGMQWLSPEKIVMPFAPPVDAPWYPQSVETPAGSVGLETALLSGLTGQARGERPRDPLREFSSRARAASRADEPSVLRRAHERSNSHRSFPSSEAERTRSRA